MGDAPQSSASKAHLQTNGAAGKGADDKTAAFIASNFCPPVEEKEKTLQEGDKAFLAGNYGDAERAYRCVILNTEAPTVPDAEYAILQANLGRSLAMLGRYAEAEAFLSKALEGRLSQPKKVKNRQAKSMQSWKDVVALGDVYTAQGRYSEAETVYEKGLRALRSEHSSSRSDVLDVKIRMAHLYDEMGRGEQSGTLHREIARATVKEYGEKSLPAIDETLRHLAVMVRHHGEPSELQSVEPLCAYTVTVTTNLKGANDPRVAEAFNLMGNIYFVRRDFKQAESFYQRALEIDEKVLGSESPAVARDLSSLAALYVEQRQIEKAKPLYERALLINQKSLGPNHPMVAETLEQIALMHQADGKIEQAEAFYRHAMEIDERAYGLDKPAQLNRIRSLAFIYFGERKYGEAEVLYLRALKIGEKNWGVSDPRLGPSLMGLASVYKAELRFPDAEAVYKRAILIDETALGKDDPGLSMKLGNLAKLYRRMKRVEEAKALETRAKDIQAKHTAG